MDYGKLSDERVLQVMGERIKLQRLDRNLTQAELADEAGIGHRTLTKMESGGVTTLATLIAVLRALDLLSNLDLLLPAPLMSPVQLADLEGQRRRKASKPRSPTTKPDKPTWEWGE